MGSAREERCVTAYDVRGANPGTGQVGQKLKRPKGLAKRARPRKGVCLSMKPSVTAQATCASTHLFFKAIVLRDGVTVD